MSRIEEFKAKEILFLGEQSGAVETKFAASILPMLAGRFERAYLARIAYGQDTEVHAALCLFGGELDRSLAESITTVFASMFNEAEHLDILRLSEAQERELSQVCRAFHGPPSPGRPAGFKAWLKWVWTGK